MALDFKIEKKLKGKLGRAGILKVTHGVIKTPAFAVVGTKGTVKSLNPEQVKETGAQVVTLSQSVGEPKEAKDYISLMEKNISSLETALTHEGGK